MSINRIEGAERSAAILELRRENTKCCAAEKPLGEKKDSWS